MWFQVILIVALVGIGVYLVRSTPSARHLAIRRLLVMLALLAGVVMVVWPGLLSWLANLVGIGRGADLLFYLAIVAGLLYVVNEYKRSVQLARANTQLAREIALTEARLTDRITELEARLATAEAGRTGR
jgi:small membrane protein